MIEKGHAMPTTKFPPLTVEDAVDYLHANMPPHYELSLTTMGKEELGDLHFSLGAHASNILGLWSGNEELMESCRLASGNKSLDADDASMLIVSLLWERLQHKDGSGLAGGGQPEEKEPVSADALSIVEALINLLDRKGIITRQELLDEMKRVRASRPE
jgi:hypothetical protein